MGHRKLGRKSGARKALIGSLLRAIFTNGRIETTEAKAKELRRYAEKVITLAKRGDLAARRLAIKAVANVGVVHKIFASSVLMFPITVVEFIDNSTIKQIAAYLQWGTPLHTAIYVSLIVFFTYFYTAVTVKIPDMADNLKKYGAFVPGIRPGKDTADYIDLVLTRLTLAGSAFLAFIAVLPTLIGSATHIHGVYFGGTALLIVVSVALHTMKQIESLVVMRHYEGFMR